MTLCLKKSIGMDSEKNLHKRLGLITGKIANSCWLIGVCIF